MSRKTSLVEITFDRLVRHWKQAALVDVAGYEVWIPYSQAVGLVEFEEGEGPGEIEIPQWLAEEKGLI